MYSCSHFKSFLSEERECIVIGAMSKRGQNTTSNDIKSEENPPGTRKVAACSQEFRNMEYTTHRYMDKIFQIWEKKFGMSAINATFSMDAYKTYVLTCGLFFCFVPSTLVRIS